MDAGCHSLSLEELLDRLEALSVAMRSYADSILAADGGEVPPAREQE
ncbi:MAG: hypothetical protein K2R98_25030 [Gemmataceae bacterium]|nr:hypothetical protein [Gemmataceae bacterium]